MRIIFNQLTVIGHKTGVGHYSCQLYRHLRSQFASQIYSYPSERWQPWQRRLFAAYQCLHSLKQRWSKVPWVYLPGSILQGLTHRLRHWYDQVQREFHRKVFFGDRYQLYHEPNFIPFPSSLPTVTTLHDLSALLYPQWHPADRVKWYEEHFQQALSQSAHFLAVSEFTRRQVIEHLGISPRRVTCVYNGARPEMRPLPPSEVERVLKRLQYPAQYLLYVGTIEPRKNVLRLMQAYCSLPSSLREAWPLLLVGRWGWHVEAEQDFYQSVGRHKGVQHVGYLADKYLPAVYNGARALLYPSYYEGFGFPPLEMLACGGAVITSTAEAVVEVVGGQAHLVAAEDTAGWGQAMARAITDHDWWRSLRAGAVAAASPFTWHRCAQQTWAVYQQVLRPAVAPPPYLDLPVLSKAA